MYIIIERVLFFMKCVYVSDLKFKDFKTSNGSNGSQRFYELTLLSDNGYPTRERVDEEVLINFGLNNPTDLVGMDINLYYSKRSYLKDGKPCAFYYVSLLQEVDS